MRLLNEQDNLHFLCQRTHQRGAGGGGAYGKYIPVTPCVGGGGGGALKNMVPFVIP
jgi:hypothetical protein